MTAFARKYNNYDWGSITWELRCVNHRYLDINVRLPEPLSSFEPKIRERVAKLIQRGRIDISAKFSPGHANRTDLTLNQPLISALVSAGQAIHHQHTEITPLRVIDLLSWQSVVETSTVISEQAQTAIIDTLEQALTECIQMREKEGKQLGQFLLGRLQQVKLELSQIKAKLGPLKQALHDKLSAKFTELQLNCDAGRLEQELVLHLQKMDISEEIDRLQSHIEHVEHSLTQGGPAIGRRLDFMMQEFNREVNTMAAKSIDAAVTGITVELKVLIEQMREQIQNIA